VHAIGQADNLRGTNGELVGLGSARAALNSNNITTTESGVQLSEFSLIVIRLSQNLNLGTIALQINEDEGSTSATNGHNTASQRNCHILDELVGLSNGLFVLATELVNTVRASELVRVWVDVLVTKTLDKSFSVFCVL